MAPFDLSIRRSGFSLVLFAMLCPLIILALAACGSPTPTPTPTMPPSGPENLLPGQSAPDDMDAIEKAAQAIAAEALGVTPDEVSVVEMEQVQWPDASLGCPQPGFMYAQVITPGFKITVEVKGKEYAVHTDAKGRGVLCMNED